MSQDLHNAVVAGAGRPNRIARIRLWFESWGAYVRTAANDQMYAWQSTLLSRRKLTHPDEVTKLRQAAPPTPRATWYR